MVEKLFFCYPKETIVFQSWIKHFVDAWIQLPSVTESSKLPILDISAFSPWVSNQQ
jgi:hypothetical protein